MAYPVGGVLWDPVGPTQDTEGEGQPGGNGVGGLLEGGRDDGGRMYVGICRG